MAMHHVHGSASIRAFGVHRRDLGDGRPSRRSQARRLRLALILTGAFMVLEVVGGLLADSLALLADAGHMLTDGLALALSLIAIRLATRPASPEHTFGYVRLEVLAALINGAVLLGISGWIAWEAWERLHAPREVNGPLLMAVATLGLVANLVCAALLRDHAADSLNVRGAYLHILGDLLGSVGTIAAGTIILFTGWNPADPLLSVFVASLILVGAWRLIREATEVLLERAPRHVDVVDLHARLKTIPNLEDVPCTCGPLRAASWRSAGTGCVTIPPTTRGCWTRFANAWRNTGSSMSPFSSSRGSSPDHSSES